MPVDALVNQPPNVTDFEMDFPTREPNPFQLTSADENGIMNTLHGAHWRGRRLDADFLLAAHYFFPQIDFKTSQYQFYKTELRRGLDHEESKFVRLQSGSEGIGNPLTRSDLPDYSLAQKLIYGNLRNKSYLEFMAMTSSLGRINSNTNSYDSQSYRLSTDFAARLLYPDHYGTMPYPSEKDTAIALVRYINVQLNRTHQSSSNDLVYYVSDLAKIRVLYPDALKEINIDLLKEKMKERMDLHRTTQDYFILGITAYNMSIITADSVEITEDGELQIGNPRNSTNGVKTTPPMPVERDF